MLTTPAQAVAEHYRAKKAREDVAAAAKSEARSFALRAWEDAEAQRSQDIELLDEIGELELSALRGQAHGLDSTGNFGLRNGSQDALSYEPTVQDTPVQGVENDSDFTVWGYKFPTLPLPEAAHVRSDGKLLEKDSSISLTFVSPTYEKACIRHPSFRVHRSCLPELQEAVRSLVFSTFCLRSSEHAFQHFEAIVMSSFAGDTCYDGLKYKCARLHCREVLPTLRSLTYHLHMHDVVVDSWSSIGKYVSIHHLTLHRLLPSGSQTLVCLAPYFATTAAAVSITSMTYWSTDADES